MAALGLLVLLVLLFADIGPAAAQSGLNGLQRQALIDGCKLRYEGNRKKHRRCLRLDANWRAALAQGCRARYGESPRKLRRCLGQSADPFSFGFGNQGFGRQAFGTRGFRTQGFNEISLDRYQRRALQDGCALRYEDDSRKYRRCLNFRGNWERALLQGCQHRYGDSLRRLRNCLDLDTAQTSPFQANPSQADPLQSIIQLFGNGTGSNGIFLGFSQPRRPTLNQTQRWALNDGCRAQYGGDLRSYRACVGQQSGWQNALVVGCERRYADIPHKLRDCLAF
ncbi:MAG: hypothetical protein QNJ92_16760 [Alphaproteobacteria bacterium]|nr:hypothetical protein [Alphaproteobacteria bacterium]